MTHPATSRREGFGLARGPRFSDNPRVPHDLGAVRVRSLDRPIFGVPKHGCEAGFDLRLVRQSGTRRISRSWTASRLPFVSRN